MVKSFKGRKRKTKYPSAYVLDFTNNFFNNVAIIANLRNWRNVVLGMMENHNITISMFIFYPVLFLIQLMIICLPPQQTSVIVIGAGMSGLAAAHTLHSYGYKVSCGTLFHLCHVPWTVYKLSLVRKLCLVIPSFVGCIVVSGFMASWLMPVFLLKLLPVVPQDH